MKFYSLLIIAALAGQSLFAEQVISDADVPASLITDYYGLNEREYYQEIQAMEAQERTVKTGANFGLIMVACPATHLAQVATFVAESLPMYSVLPKIFMGSRYSRDRNLMKVTGDNSELRITGGMFLGGPANALADFAVQFLFGMITRRPGPAVDVESIKKSFLDGYAVSIKWASDKGSIAKNAPSDGSKNLNSSCYRAERRYQMLVGLIDRRIK